MLSQHLCVAILFYQKEIPLNISDKTGVISATIERVKQSLLYGEDGYKILIKQMKRNKHSKRDTHEL